MFLILDVTSSHEWPDLRSTNGARLQVSGPRRIPAEHRPTVLQDATREEAEREVARLLQASPQRTYALFECVAQAHTAVMPWAVTGAGDVVKDARVPRWRHP